jgi:hypothetical protein
MSTLVVYYSFTGTCRLAAMAIAAVEGWPTAEITDAASGRGTLRCVIDSLLRRRPRVLYQGPPVESADLVVLVSPIWARRLAGPMRSFVASHRDGLRDVAVVSVMGEGGAPNAVAEVGALLGRSPVLSTAFLAQEVLDGSFDGRAQAFVHALVEGRRPHAPLRAATWSPNSA